MTSSARFLRWLAGLLTTGGFVVVAVAALELIRPLVEGPLANLIPNVPLAAPAVIAGVAALVGGAVARRRLAQTSTLSAAAADGQLETTTGRKPRPDRLT